MTSLIGAVARARARTRTYAYVRVRLYARRAVQSRSRSRRLSYVIFKNEVAREIDMAIASGELLKMVQKSARSG